MDGFTIYELEIGDFSEQTNVLLMENAQHYATITGDNNPIHFDTEFARNSRFRRPIAHGMILAGFISGVLGTKLPGYGCLYEEQRVSFLRPVFYGDTIRTRVTVMKLNFETNRVTLLTECFNQNNETVLSGTAVMLPKKA